MRAGGNHRGDRKRSVWHRGGLIRGFYRAFFKETVPTFAALVRPIHFITIGVAALLAAVLFLVVPTAPPVAANPAGKEASHQDGHVDAASTQEVLALARKAVGAHGLSEIRKVEDSLANATTDSAQMTAGFARLAKLWASHRQGSAAGHYLALEAGLEKSPKKLTFAGRFFLNLVANQPDDAPEVRMWNAEQAVDLFRKANDLAPTDSTKLDLASAYIEGTGETMQGVQLLLGVVQEQPDNVPALLLLGRLAIQSGQWEKAIERFDHVLQKDPQNTEAIYFLAEAYKGKGDRSKAVQYFERAKKVVNNPEFSRDVDDYLKTF